MTQHLEICEVAHGSPEYWETADLRNRVLRQPIGLKFSPEDIEAEKHYRHFACYFGDRLAACLMLDPLENGDIRMRQLAVLPELQRQGVGKSLVAHAEEWARKAGYRRMTLHARETAVTFYEALGYSRGGARFEEVTIQHWAMDKRLTI
ncbi:MAG: GNAT family N-acetyltransferase [Planctomycetaceae bacterium]|nr:GNAT family N-acetyltransferase [Planctomycetaceae bacterium]